MTSSLQLLTLCKDGKGRITKCSPHVQSMNNGIEYYVVEVTCIDGIQYGIQAFGQEAITTRRNYEDDSGKSGNSLYRRFSWNRIELWLELNFWTNLNPHRIIKRVQKLVLVLGFVSPDSCLGSFSVWTSVNCEASLGPLMLYLRLRVKDKSFLNLLVPGGNLKV